MPVKEFGLYSRAPLSSSPFPPAAMSSAQHENTPLIGLMSGMSIQFFMRFSSFSVEYALALQSSCYSSSGGRVSGSPA